VQATSARSNPLLVLRLLYVQFPISLVLVLAGLLFLDFRLEGGLLSVESSIVVATGLASSTVLLFFHRRPLPQGTPSQIAASYRTFTVLKSVLAMAPAVFAFVTGFAFDTLLPYLVALVFAVPGLAVAAPTAADIARRQEELNQQSDVDLLGALTGRIAAVQPSSGCGLAARSLWRPRKGTPRARSTRPPYPPPFGRRYLRTDDRPATSAGPPTPGSSVAGGTFPPSGGLFVGATTTRGTIRRRRLWGDGVIGLLRRRIFGLELGTRRCRRRRRGDRSRASTSG